MARADVCRSCGGSGLRNGIFTRPIVTCPECGGVGRHPSPQEIAEAARRYGILKRLIETKRQVYITTRTSPEVMTEVFLISVLHSGALEMILETGENLDNVLDKLESRQLPEAVHETPDPVDGGCHGIAGPDPDSR